MSPMRDPWPDPCAPRADAAREAALARLDRLAWCLDSAVRIPGTSVRVGADAVANLLPGVGPLISKGVSAWLILEAARLGAPRALLLRMVGHVALDAAIGAVPVVGWAADVLLRANRRNMDLLRAHLARPPPASPHGTPSASAAAPAPANRNDVGLRSPA